MLCKANAANVTMSQLPHKYDKVRQSKMRWATIVNHFANLSELL